MMIGCHSCETSKGDGEAWGPITGSKVIEIEEWSLVYKDKTIVDNL